MKWNRSIMSIAVVLLFGFGLFFIGTDGFQAFTAETARTKALMKEQPKFPVVTLEDSKERVYSFSEFEGKYVMLTFIYTACSDVCPTLERNLAEVYEQLPKKYIGEEIMFLSISFDPDRDTPEILDKYRVVFNSDGETWRMARINDKNELQNLLDRFGVIVIPDGNGHFVHNSAFYLVNPDGYLIEVLDYEAIDAAAEKVTEILEEKVGS